jgi:uncharacterized protein YqgV (UPF0045/DUF77 family)
MLNPLLSYQSNFDIAKAEAAQNALAQQQADKETVLNSLSGHLRTKWEQAKRAKISVEQRMLKCKRARNGEYEPQKLAAIKATFGADYDPIFMMVTATKCQAAHDWIRDAIFGQGNSVPWDLSPTPVPELQQEVITQITEIMYQAEIERVVNQMASTGIETTIEQIMAAVDQSIPNIIRSINRQIKIEANDAAERMKAKIKDQFIEGGWEAAIDECIYDLVTYPACILKGPFYQKDRLQKIDFNTKKPQLVERIVDQYERRSPFNIYPAPGAVGINDSYIFDRVQLKRKALSDMIGIPGYDENAIREVLRMHRAGLLREWTAIDTEKARLEGRESMSVYESEDIDCLEYWGTASGRELLQWGMTTAEISDEDKEYNICAWIIGPYIIKAQLNPDPLGNKPFSKASFIDDPDSFWGMSIPERIYGIQNLCNAVARAIVNNVGLASGPQVEIDKERFVDGQNTNIVPWKKWLTTNARMVNRPAINFIHTPLIAEQLMNVFEFCLKQADEDSGVPRYAHGDANVGGAGRTASGLSMLMTQAAKGIKGAIRNIDVGLIETCVKRQYQSNLMYETDIALYCDLKVAAKGSASLIAKEQQAIRRTEFLATTANDVDMQIIGLRGRKKLLEDTVKSLELNLDPEIDFEINYMGGEQHPRIGTEAVIGSNGNVQPQNKPARLNVAGDTSSGMDFNLTQNGEI